MSPEFIQAYRHDSQAIRAELSAGLLAERAFISPKYLYDALGSRLFDAICELPEYYPTRTEAAIVAAHRQDMADAVGDGITMIDLGAGNCAKAAGLFASLRPRQYVPIDISVDFLRDKVQLLQQQFPGIDMLGIGMDFSAELTLPSNVRAEKRLFFYPGSSIGNFTPQQALTFLRGLRQSCEGATTVDGGVLIGVDLVKERGLLEAAYDDALGVTAAFNLNLLRHLRQLLGADFEVRDWRHRSYYNADESRIEMHLEARRDLTVTWSDAQRRFAEGERIHTENSYKYTRDDFLSLLAQAGFGQPRVWTDDHEWFMMCHARAI